MPTYEDKPGWELEGRRPPHDEQFEAEAERLRHNRAMSFMDRLAERERRRALTSAPPPTVPPAA
jgi:hypothetical protein